MKSSCIPNKKRKSFNLKMTDKLNCTNDYNDINKDWTWEQFLNKQNLIKSNDNLNSNIYNDNGLIDL